MSTKGDDLWAPTPEREWRVRYCREMGGDEEAETVERRIRVKEKKKKPKKEPNGRRGDEIYEGFRDDSDFSLSRSSCCKGNIVTLGR